jgi:hypothetical protein
MLSCNAGNAVRLPHSPWSLTLSTPQHLHSAGAVGIEYHRGRVKKAPHRIHPMLISVISGKYLVRGKLYFADALFLLICMYAHA